MKSARVLPPVLVVDDDDNDALILSRRLKDAGARNPVLHFRHGGDVFVYLNKLCAGGESEGIILPMLMFLDVNMPSLSGFDILLWARQQAMLRPMKIVMMSGATEPYDAQIAAKLGATDYVTKFPESSRLTELLGASTAPEVA